MEKWFEQILFPKMLACESKIKSSHPDISKTFKQRTVASNKNVFKCSKSTGNKRFKGSNTKQHMVDTHPAFPLSEGMLYLHGNLYNHMLITSKLIL